MSSGKHFSASRLAALAKARTLGVRSGREHRYTGVWVVIVEDRVFVRSWDNSPTGWYKALRTQPAGSIHTKASLKWVAGFGEPRREATTLELVPG